MTSGLAWRTSAASVEGRSTRRRASPLDCAATCAPPPSGRPKKYGLTIWRVNAILRAQGDACAICGESPGDAAIEGPSYWQIDHDHTCCSGCARCVRGLLCMPCNARGVAWYENLDEARRDWPRMNAYLSDPPAHRPEAQVQWLDLGRVRGREGSSSAAASDAFTTAMDRHQPSPSPEQ
ncbi:endonuclease domain-containing protein [Streptomyces sp. NPDC002722]|uniref:endonuclease domain-containing protein n=1 Tax=Streptomyces sp. NPDC002722 TaxID=3154425 RepID=UPI0033293BA1